MSKMQVFEKQVDGRRLERVTASPAEAVTLQAQGWIRVEAAPRGGKPVQKEAQTK